MNEQLSQKTQIWENMKRETEQQREEVEEYYENELMDLIVEEFIKNNKEKVTETVDYMILSVGASFEPLVLNLSLFRPKKILFLYTDFSEKLKVIDKIVDFCRLNISDFQKEKVNETDPLDIYKKVKNAYLEWNMPSKLYIDISGGTKVMSVAASLVGAMIDVQLVYIGNTNFLKNLRKPCPGSETLCYIDNPYEVFGDFEIEKAFHLFGQYNYAGAREQLSQLKEKVPDAVVRRQLDFVFWLAQMYESWDSLEFSEAYITADTLIREMEKDRRLNPRYILMDSLDILKEQKEILYPLATIKKIMKDNGKSSVFGDEKYIVPLMFTMLQNSFIREKQEKYDSATLLLYRLLEMIEQRRLALYGIDVSEADFLKMKYPIDRLKELEGKNEEQCLEWYTKEINKMKKKVFKKSTKENSLSEKIALLDGYIHLAVLQDEIMTGDGEDSIKILGRLCSAVSLRNNSIFAHGISPVSKDNFKKFKEYVLSLFKKFCSVEGIDFEAYTKKMEYVDPAKSKYNFIGKKHAE
jgi:CRISPR-associated protein (TIGR02710 family)